MSCPYTGCNAPEGECSGACLTQQTSGETLEEIAAHILNALVEEYGVPGEGKNTLRGYSITFAEWLTRHPAILDHIPAVKALREEIARLTSERDMFEQSVAHWKKAYREDTETLRDSKECALAHLHEVVKAGQNLSFMAQTTGGGPDLKLIEAINSFAKTLELRSVADAHRQHEGQRERITDLESQLAELEALAESRLEQMNADRKAYNDLRDELIKVKSQLAELQAKYDALMLEFCPEEMTAEQFQEWGRNQVPESQLAELRQGGEAVGEVVLESMGVGDAKVVRFHMYKEIPPVGTKLYTQPAIPPGYAVVPLIPTRAMEDVVNQDEWQWEDLLAAAEAITEDQYNEIASAPAIQPQAASAGTQEAASPTPSNPIAEQDAKDAARYRYLTSIMHITDNNHPICKLYDALKGEVPSKEQLDAAFDAAMLTQQKEGEK